MAEVMHRVPEEEVVEPPLTWRPDESNIGDIINGVQEVNNNGISENSVYFDKSEGMWKCHHCNWTYKIGNNWLDHVHHKSFTHGYRGTTSQLTLSVDNLNLETIDIPKLVNAVMNNQNVGNVKDEIASVLIKPTPIEEETIISTSGSVRENLTTDLVEESNEEVIELEFERAVEKVHTHTGYTAYCPNCSSQITKVILRRRKKEKVRPSVRDEPVDLFGCLSCFSIFIPSGNGLNPFRLFGKKANPESAQIVEEKHDLAPNLPVHAEGSTNVNASTTIKQGNAFDLFGIFRKREIEKAQDSQGNNQVKQKGESSNSKENSIDNSTTALGGSSLHVPLLHGHLSSSHAIKDEHNGSTKIGEPQKPDHYREINPPDVSIPSGHVAIHIGDNIDSASEIREDQQSGNTQQNPGTGVTDTSAHKRALVASTNGSSKSLEILKCIVYGGLMESIASLSVVSSAAASDATTLNIICIGLATVISGLFILGHNLMDLKNDDARQNSKDRYQELLGKRGHFLLHSTFAMLSFLICGLMPPVIYGFTLRESDNKDYKLLVVASASFTCVFILAIAKAYAQRSQKLSEYFKTVLYYLTMTISVSGVSYAAGDLIKMLMDRFGWFEPAPVVSPTFASY